MTSTLWFLHRDDAEPFWSQWECRHEILTLTGTNERPAYSRARVQQPKGVIRDAINKGDIGFLSRIQVNVTCRISDFKAGRGIGRPALGSDDFGVQRTFKLRKSAVGLRLWIGQDLPVFDHSRKVHVLSPCWMYSHVF